MLCGISTGASQRNQACLESQWGTCSHLLSNSLCRYRGPYVVPGRLQPATLNVGAGSALPVLPETPRISEELPAIDRQEVRPRAICPRLLSATAVADAQQVSASLQNELPLASRKKMVLRGKRDKKPVTFTFIKEVCMREEIREKRKNSTTAYLAGTERCVTICACFRASGILCLEKRRLLHPTN